MPYKNKVQSHLISLYLNLTYVSYILGQFFRNFQVYTENLQTEDKEEILFVPSQNESKVR